MVERQVKRSTDERRGARQAFYTLPFAGPFIRTTERISVDALNHSHGCLSAVRYATQPQFISSSVS